jgi:uncharacterized repeat protein (TIGR03847 family)
MGLGYDESEDAVVLVVQELTTEEESGDARIARFWATRSQMQAISRHALEVVAMGRPICPLCSRPIDAEGHFCPKSNGHDRVH